MPSTGFGARRMQFPDLQGLSQRRLKLHRPQTLESLEIVYWKDGDYDESALAAIDWFMRDVRTGAAVRIDRVLLDMLCSMHRATESDEPFTILSAYRSEETNARLIGRGAARNSYHLQGAAVDLRLKGFSTKGLKYLARARQIGGIGYYPRKGFLHCDTGPIRSWRG